MEPNSSGEAAAKKQSVISGNHCEGRQKVATKGRQLIVAISENPGAGFGDLLCVCDLPFRSTICPVFIAVLPVLVLVVVVSQMCPRVPGVRWKLVVRHLGQPPLPHCPFVRKRPKLSACPCLLQ